MRNTNDIELTFPLDFVHIWLGVCTVFAYFFACVTGHCYSLSSSALLLCMIHRFCLLEKERR